DSTPALPFVTFEEEEDEEQGDTAEQLERKQGVTVEELEEEEVIKKGRTPSLILIKSARDEIRRYKEDELIEFTAKNFKKQLRDKYIFDGREGRITTLKDWARIVFLASKHKERRSA
ncbi:hypothetical protein ACJMK2_024679, partial [Sinanodonta woodiana]